MSHRPIVAAAFNHGVLTQDLKRDGGPVRLLLMIDDDLVVAFAGDELAVLEPRGHERNPTLGLVSVVLLKRSKPLFDIFLE